MSVLASFDVQLVRDWGQNNLHDQAESHLWWLDSLVMRWRWMSSTAGHFEQKPLWCLVWWTEQQASNKHSSCQIVQEMRHFSAWSRYGLGPMDFLCTSAVILTLPFVTPFRNEFKHWASWLSTVHQRHTIRSAWLNVAMLYFGPFWRSWLTSLRRWLWMSAQLCWLQRVMPSTLVSTPTEGQHTKQCLVVSRDLPTATSMIQWCYPVPHQWQTSMLRTLLATRLSLWADVRLWRPFMNLIAANIFDELYCERPEPQR